LKTKFLIIFMTLISVNVLLSTSLFAKEIKEKSPQTKKFIDPIFYKLDNGLEVLLYENHKSPTATCRVYYKVGARCEETGYTGVSHMLEHLMFKGTKKLGTKNYPKDSIIWASMDSLYDSKNRDSNFVTTEKALMKSYEKIAIKNHFWTLLSGEGAVGVNAYTTKNGTVYFSSLPINKIELWMAIESDRMVNSVFREFYSEKQVVREERRLRYEVRPWGKVYETLFAYSYKSHPYRTPVIGWANDIDNYKLDYIKKYYKKYYAPNNAVLIISGDINVKKTKQMINKWFSPLKSSKIENKHITKERILKDDVVVELKDKVKPFSMMSYKLVSSDLSADVRYDLLQIILSGGKSSRMYKELIKKQGIAISADCYEHNMEDPGLFIFTLTPVSGITNDSLISATTIVIDSLLSGGIKDWEMEKARNNLKTYFYGQLETNEGISSLLGDFQVRGGWNKINSYIKDIDLVTKDELLKVAKELFSNGRVIVKIGGIK